MISNKINFDQKARTDREVEDIIYHENELSPDQWKELQKRGAEIDAGKAVMITTEELKNLLSKRRSELRFKS